VSGTDGPAHTIVLSLRMSSKMDQRCSRTGTGVCEDYSASVGVLARLPLVDSTLASRYASGSGGVVMSGGPGHSWGPLTLTSRPELRAAELPTLRAATKSSQLSKLTSPVDFAFHPRPHCVSLGDNLYFPCGTSTVLTSIYLWYPNHAISQFSHKSIHRRFLVRASVHSCRKILALQTRSVSCFRFYPHYPF